jgi:2-methylisocitrate lyase-like PEP mutase family enzyme
VDETISRLTANVAAGADGVFVSLLFRTALSAANAALATIARDGLPPADVLSYAEARTLSESAMPTDIGPSAEDR